MKDKYCSDFINKSCKRDNCKFIHDIHLCTHFWKYNKCKFGEQCKFNHIRNNHKKSNKKNTETFKPINKNDIDMRILFHDANYNKIFNNIITTKDVITIKNLFSDFQQYDIYNKLVYEIKNCGIEESKLLKLWHGDTHLIADDKLNWKSNCPTFSLIIERIREYFNMDIQATRFNWYKDTSTWKPFHFDAAAIDKEKAKIQNFTIAISFGAVREVAFERDTKDKIRISIPHYDGDCYAFCKDTNILWRHGILKENEIKQEGRISIICWGWLNNMQKI